MQAVILAGGLATRLGELTVNLPKSLIQVARRPFIDYQLALLKQAQVEEVVLCVGCFGEQVAVHCGDGSSYGLKIQYSEDGKKLCGTGGALKKAEPLLNDQFFVMYGDSYLQCDYASIWKYFSGQDVLGLMTVYENHNQYDHSNVAVDGKLVSEYDKNNTKEMAYVDYGLSIFKKVAITSHQAKESMFDLSEVHQKLVRQKQLLAYRVANRFFEIGSIRGLAEFRQMVTVGQGKQRA